MGSTLIFAGLSGRTELLETQTAEIAHAIHRRLQEFARIEFVRLRLGDATEFSRHRQPAVRVDVDLADAMLDAAHDLLDRHAESLPHRAAIGVEIVLQLLRHRRRAVHDEMGVRQFGVDRLDDAHREDVAVRLAREFIGAMRRAHRDGQRIDLGPHDEIDGLVGIGQQLIAARLAFGAMAVLLFTACHVRASRARPVRLRPRRRRHAPSATTRTVISTL